MKLEYEIGKEIAKNCPFGFRCLLPSTAVLLLGTAGALLLAPVVVPAVKKVGKSVAKATIKGGMTVYEGSKALVSEAKAELVEAPPEA
ncbi:hypothetical protein CKA32_004527 [Geitlerinema sp. FC II]|nr:hypothetical protein CKA32_004527 [Geitlerinema sp. FC II]